MREEPLRRTAFAVFRPMQTRWSDNDVYGHMNNVVHYALFDTAINGWLIEAGLVDPREGAIVGLVVETACQYFAELGFPEAVDAGIAIERLGRSSVTYRIALFASGSDTAAAQGRFTHVYVERKSRRPVALDERWRGVLETIWLEG